MARFFIILLLLFFVTASIVAPFRVVSASMEDTLLVGDAFLALKYHYGIRLPILNTMLVKLSDPAPGDLLIFQHPIEKSQVYVKRCIAVAGQTVEIREKKLFVDGVEVPLPETGKHGDDFVFKKGDSGKGKRDFLDPVKIPKSSIFVMGDNRDFSIDSRILGPIPLDLVRGKVGPVFWSHAKADSLGNKGGIRFERMFKQVK